MRHVVHISWDKIHHFIFIENGHGFKLKQRFPFLFFHPAESTDGSDLGGSFRGCTIISSLRHVCFVDL